MLANQEVVLEGNLVVTKSLIGQAEDLAAEHEAFNTNYVIGGRKALYSLLGKIAVLVDQFDAAVDKADLIKIVRKNLQEQYGIKTQDNTSDITVLVRYITRAERKTAHVYARAIETARANQIAPAQFTEYLEQAGGIEQIRAIGVDTQAAEAIQDLEEEQLSLAYEFLNARTEMPFASFDAPKAFNGIYSKNCTYEYVICSVSANGQYNVLGKLPAEVTFEHYAIRFFSKHLCKDIDQARTGVAKVVTEAQKRRAVREAVDQAKHEVREEMNQSKNQSI